MTPRMTIAAIAIAAGTIVSASGMAFADTDRALPEGSLGIDKVAATVEAEGYTRISEIESDDGYYEVTATHPDGRRVELRVDPQSGEILRIETEDD
ncbi:MAG: hypothetical protein CMM50_04890 [Rhodospirillaceae bacterium]|nr:hypothetical protein [Rhodospirillaceae bacterium]